MTDDDLPPGEPVTDAHLRFLAVHTRTFLLVRGPAGAPTGYPMIGRLIDGALEFSTYRKSAKVRNIERDGRVCCVVIPRDRGLEDRVLVTWGTATLSDTSSARWAKTGEDDRGAAGIDVPAEVAERVARRTVSGKRAILRVELARARFTGAPSNG